MNVILTVLLILSEVFSEEEEFRHTGFSEEEEFRLTGLFFGCSKDVTGDYHRALQDFSTRLYKEVAKENEDHFVVSQYSVWLALSSLAEGSEGEAQKTLFKELNLPEDSCLREKYYEIATCRETSAEDVTFSRKRVLIAFNDLKLNSSWANAVRSSGLIDTQTENIYNKTESINDLQDIVNGSLKNVLLTGNSILFDTLDYAGLWTMAFDNALFDSYSDFFNDNGDKIGSVDLLVVKRRVKLAYIPFLNAKLLELPVGNYGRYRMLFIMNRGKTSIRSTIEHFPPNFIVDIMPLMIESVFPLEIAVPKFSLTSELDLKNALQNIGFGSIWNDGNASKYISDPHLLPLTFYQRVSISIDQPGTSPPPRPFLPNLAGIVTDIEGLFGRKFIANRPFIYGLVDAETRTWLFAGAYSKPGPVAD